MKTLFSILILAGMAMPSHAAVNRYSGQIYVPVSKNAVADINLQNSRFDVARIGDTTGTVLVHSGSGRLLSLCMVGPVATAFALAYDTTGTTAVTTTNFASYPSILMGPPVFASSTSAAVAAYGKLVGCYEPKYPLPYSNGLVVASSALGQVAVVVYQKD